MKKSFIYALAMAMTLSFSLASCGSDDDDLGLSEGADIVNPDVTPANTVWTVAEQQDYLDEIGKEMQKKLDPSALQEYSDFVQEVSRVIQNADFESLGDEFEDKMMDAVSGNESHMKMILSMALVKGHYTVGSYGLTTYEKANDTQLSYTDAYGRRCVMALNTSGSTKKVHVTHEVDDDEDYGRVEKDTYVELPSHITVTLSRDSRQMIKENVDIDLSNVKEELNVAKTELSFKSVAELDNGYSIVVDRTSYNGKSLSAKVSLVNGKETLMVMKAGANLSGIPSATLSELVGMVNEEAEELTSIDTKDVYYGIDILGRMQIKATIKDGREFEEALRACNEYNESESMFKSYLAKAAEQFDGGIYFNGGTAKQAALAPVAIKDNSYWYVDYALIFDDGSQIDFDSYLNGSSLKEYIEMMSRLVPIRK